MSILIVHFYIIKAMFSNHNKSDNAFDEKSIFNCWCKQSRL